MRSTRDALLLVLLATTLVAAPSHAAPTAPNVVDPAGDAGFDGVTAPTGFEWGDIEAVWFEENGADVVTAFIEVAGLDSPPPFAEIAVRLAVNGSHSIAGWTTVPFPPGIYMGGFFCSADEDYVAKIETCTRLEGVTAKDDVYTVPLPRGLINAIETGAVITRINAYADIWVGVASWAVDRTEEGRDHVLDLGASGTTAEPSKAEGAEGPTDGADAATDDAGTARAEDAKGSRVSEDAPGPGLGFSVFAALAVAAVLAGRRLRA